MYGEVTSLNIAPNPQHTFRSRTHILPSVDEISDSIICLDYIDGNNTAARRLLSCAQNGVVRIYTKFDKPNDLEFESFTIPSPIAVAKFNPAKNAIGFGGQENDVKLWDIETQKISWRAKNVPYDFLDMRVPVWVKDLDFFPQNPATFAMVSAHKHIRIYDTRKQRRPVFSVEMGEHPLMKVRCAEDGNSIFYSDATGRLLQMDVRGADGKHGQVIGGFKGMIGAIRGIEFCSGKNFGIDGDVLVSVGLDRFLRIHDLQTRKLFKRLYMKQRLTKLLVRELSEAEMAEDESSDEDENDSDEKEEDDSMHDEDDDLSEGEDDDDELWEELEKEGKLQRKKKRKITKS
eukprot:TRINITY_DN8380_c0_g1_i1.p1 TRINITY_DN8380_c0_g1~~TRINITY_DN8380_c0_g1_i1.p1  ORF type:complete len:346 (+),score=64.32 TRINITY_DN8380_c0_g1_i1:131-1168(+)